MIVSTQAYQGRGVHSIYNKEESTKSKNGSRVKLGTTGTAAGQSAPPYIVISGLTEADMPLQNTPDGVLILEIPKLSVGGMVDPDNGGVGFVVFIHSDGSNDASVNRFHHQTQITYNSFINSIRKTRFGFDAERDGAIPNKLTAVSWNDGAQDQLKASFANFHEWESKRIIVNKQNLARTSSEQPEDLSPKYKIFRRECDKNSNYTDIEDLKSDAQLHLQETFASLKISKVLRLSKNKEYAIIDFVCTIPDIMAKHLSPAIIMKGFIENGAIDANCQHCPDLYQMLVGTTRREIGKDEMNNILHHFVGLLKEQLQTGYLSDEVLERAGIHQDLDNTGKVVRHNFPITSEHRQRSKTLNHAVQIMERQRVVDAKEAIMKQKCKVECCSRKKILENNALLMSKIFEAYKSIHPHKNVTTLVDVSLHGFAHKLINATMLKAFIPCQKFRTSKATGGWVPKRTALEAAKGVDCLILQAYRMCTEEVVLQLENEEEGHN